MDKIEYFFECLLPITACNLNCHYCYVIQRHNRLMKPARLRQPVDRIVHALRKERIGGCAYFSICGAGETMMQAELTDITHGLLKEGHYVNITTNGTITKSIDRLLAAIPADLLKHLNFSFSYHYIELIARNRLDVFFDNIDKVRKAGCSFVVQVNLTDEYEPFFEQIKSTCLQRTGALPQLAATRDEIDLSREIRLFTRHSQSEYTNVGNEFRSPLFTYTMQNFMVKRTEYCHAGKWGGVIDLETGIFRPCYASARQQNLYADDAPIRYVAIGRHCQSPFCMNSSHFISLGMLPDYADKSSYATLRNRVCADGSEWYTPEMKSFLSQKLYENHAPDTKGDKLKSELFFLCEKLAGLPKRILPKSLKNAIRNKLHQANRQLPD